MVNWRYVERNGRDIFMIQFQQCLQGLIIPLETYVRIICQSTTEGSVYQIRSKNREYPLLPLLLVSESGSVTQLRRIDSGFVMWKQWFFHMGQVSVEVRPFPPTNRHFIIVLYSFITTPRSNQHIIPKVVSEGLMSDPVLGWSSKKGSIT